MSKSIVIDGREILGSTGRYTRKLLAHLQQLDTQNQYHLLLHQEAMDAINLPSQNFHKHLVTQRKFSLAEQVSLPGVIKKLQPDLVHFPMIHQPYFIKLKTITTMHDLTPLRFRDLATQPLVFKIRQTVFKLLSKRVAKSASRIIVDTDYVKSDIQKFTGVPSKKISTIYLAGDVIAEAAEPLPNLSRKQFIFYVGRAQAHKNLGRLIQAFEKLKSDQPDLLMVLAGSTSGNYELIQNQAQSSSVESSIIFTDFISDGQLRWLYENALAYVFPSLSEGFGLPGLEAMAHGCPLLSSNATCLPEVYGDAAHYFNPEDVDDMAQKIMEVLDDENLRRQLAERGFQQVQKYSWRRMAEQTLDIYQKVLNK